jgi:hypothetical protein
VIHRVRSRRFQVRGLRDHAHLRVAAHRQASEYQQEYVVSGPPSPGASARRTSVVVSAFRRTVKDSAYQACPSGR